MPTYSAVFELNPAGVFGVPEGQGHVVIPASPGATCISPVVSTQTGKLVGHSTLSRYREMPLERNAEITGINVRLEDNFVHMNFIAPEDGVAWAACSGLMMALCLELSLQTARYFSWKIVEMISTDQRRVVKTPDWTKLFSATFYNLDELGGQIDKALESIPVLGDERLKKALEYYYHALLLRNALEGIDPRTGHSELVGSEAVLNFHKAVSAVIGDQAAGDKDYQARMNRLNLPQSTNDGIKKLKEWRDSHDVAHYSLDWSSLAAIDPGAAGATARDVIKAYTDLLRTQQPQ